MGLCSIIFQLTLFVSLLAIVFFAGVAHERQSGSVVKQLYRESLLSLWEVWDLIKPADPYHYHSS
jgi:hypothetical protein